MSDTDKEPIDPATIPTGAPFETLFPVDADVRRNIRTSMRERGFISGCPLFVWREQNILVDGHTRRDVAMELGVKVLVEYRDFANTYEAIKFAYEMQTYRRHATEEQKAQAAWIVDEEKRKAHGGDRGNQYASKPANTSREVLANTNGRAHSSAQEVADLVGVSRATVERIRFVRDHGDDEIKEKVRTGQVAPGTAVKQIKAKPTVPAKLAEALANPSKASAPSEAVPAVIATPTKALAVPSCLGGVPDTGIHTDLMAYEMIAPLLSEMRRMATERIGTPTVRTPPLFRIIWDLVTVCPPQEWTLCPACDGSGVRSGVGLCKRCNGFGYHVSHN